MNKFLLCLLVFWVVGCANRRQIVSPAPVTYPDKPMDVRQLAITARPAIVALNIFFEENNEELLYTATGFLVAPELVVTTYHGLEGQFKKIVVLWDHKLPNAPLQAQVVAVDIKNDLALLKLSTKQSMRLQLSDQVATLGEAIVLLGFPEATQVEDENIKYLHVFQGNIASLQFANASKNLIIDARVLRGNSGSPVLSLHTGKVMGVVIEVVVDREEEDRELPSGKTQKQSIEGESLGIAVSVEAIRRLLQKYRNGKA